MSESTSKDFETILTTSQRDQQLLRNIYSYGWSEMSQPQQMMLPKLINKDDYDDVSFQYPSGMGKSGVYILTLLCNLSRKNCINGLIVLPTRELANQVYSVCNAFAKKLDINVCKCIGQEEISEINPEWPTIIIGTCGKIINVMCKNKCRSLQQDCALEYFVIDEADNFIEGKHNKNIYDLETIIKTLCDENTHVFTFSATFSTYVRDFIRKKIMRKNGRNIEEYMDDSEVTLSGITQYYVDISSYINRQNAFNMKIETMLDIIPIIGLSRGIIFCNSTNHAKQVYDVLLEENYTCEVIYGRMTQDERNDIMRNFSKSGINFLIATDLIARGIDFKDISYVIQLELPVNIEDYIHRIGRSGRYGKVGTAIAIIADKEERKYLDIITERFEIDMKQFEFN